ncbi:MAG TPA: L,D-transpeptidase, partial [Gammaproteobacteria bacterium]|nr:L,D-transpeptidase [Gammaproteobacteria bacterium]
MDRSGTQRLRLRVELAAQTLTLHGGGRPLKTYAVSTSKHGAGEISGSFKTPRGRHVVRAKIGAGAP